MGWPQLVYIGLTAVVGVWHFCYLCVMLHRKHQLKQMKRKPDDFVERFTLVMQGAKRKGIGLVLWFVAVLVNYFLLYCGGYFD